MSNEALIAWMGRYLALIGENLKEGESVEVDMQILMIKEKVYSTRNKVIGLVIN